MKLHRKRIRGWLVKIIALLVVLFLIFAGISFLFL